MKIQKIPSLADEQSPDRYRDDRGVRYIPPSTTGRLSIPVLEFLVGLRWDVVALNYVHALNPASIRVTSGEVTSDSREGRVTVWLDSSDRITGIEQEVEVGLRGAMNGRHLADQVREARKKRGLQ